MLIAGTRNSNAAGSTCSSWTVSTGNGKTGSSSATDNAWTNVAATQACAAGSPRRLYCFEQ